jgi:hypothetical protein
MAAIGAIRRRQLPNGSIQQLLLDVLHWVMGPASYRRIRVVIKIAGDLPAFFVIVDVVVGHNHS